MPRELNSSEEREYSGYMALGPLEDVKARLGKLPKVQEEAGTQRKRIAELEKENGELKAKVPDGAVVLTGDEAKAYEAAKATHGSVAELAKKADRTDAAEQEVAKRDRQDGYRRAARTEGWDEDAALGFFNDSEAFRALPFEIRKETRETKARDGSVKTETVEVGYLTVDGKAVPLATWQAENAKHWTPGLTVASNGGGQQQVAGREAWEARGRSEPSAKKTEEDFKRATDSTANYTL